MQKKEKVLMKNTIMLYILTFSNYLFNFITVPYQTRILGPEIYGKLGFALAFTTYFQLFFDFGFILSATEDVSKNRNNNKELKKILTSVNILKIIFIILSMIVLAILCLSIQKFREDVLLYVLFFIYIAINSLLPDFLYRGIEKMKFITYRSVGIKFFFTVMIFIFLRNKNQYYIVPILNIIGATIAVIVVYWHVIKKLNIHFVKVEKSYLKETFKKASVFFSSRIATTVYSSTNTFILGFIYPVGNILGLYTTSDKLISTAKSALTPISDSVYPYMVKNKDFKLVKKLIMILTPIILIGCIFVGIFAEFICGTLFGEEYVGAANILRIMLPLVVIALPNFLLGFPTMTPLGLSKYANLSVIIGAVGHILGISILVIVKQLNVYSICILTIITEVVVMATRIFCIVKNKNIRKNINEENIEY